MVADRVEIEEDRRGLDDRDARRCARFGHGACGTTRGPDHGPAIVSARGATIAPSGRCGKGATIIVYHYVLRCTDMYRVGRGDPPRVGEGRRRSGGERSAPRQPPSARARDAPGEAGTQSACPTSLLIAAGVSYSRSGSAPSTRTISSGASCRLACSTIAPFYAG